MKKLLRQTIQKVSPRLWENFDAARRRRAGKRIEERIRPVIEEVVARQGWVVRSGPFAGMKYVREARGSVLLPKLAGFYERELFEWVAEIQGRPYDAAVDVGCAEGYYAVGLARTMPAVDVYAFDIDASAQALCSELARINGVADRVHVAGECDHAGLSRLIAAKRRVLIVCDCEGFEDLLLDPARVAGLDGADMLVETHDFAVPGVTEKLRGRFAATHEIRQTPAVAMRVEDFPEIAHFDPVVREEAISEFRPEGMQWLLMTSKKY